MYINNLFNETVRKEGDKYVVRSKKGKSMGSYDSKSAAEKRLRQVEMFKHMAESIKLSEAERDIQVEVPGIGVYTADTLSSNIIQSIDKLHRAAEAGDWEQVEYSLDPSKMGGTLLIKSQALVQALKQNRMLEETIVTEVDWSDWKDEKGNTVTQANTQPKDSATTTTVNTPTDSTTTTANNNASSTTISSTDDAINAELGGAEVAGLPKTSQTHLIRPKDVPGVLWDQGADIVKTVGNVLANPADSAEKIFKPAGTLQHVGNTTVGSVTGQVGSEFHGLTGGAFKGWLGKNNDRNEVIDRLGSTMGLPPGKSYDDLSPDDKKKVNDAIQGYKENRGGLADWEKEIVQNRIKNKEFGTDAMYGLGVGGTAAMLWAEEGGAKAEKAAAEKNASKLKEIAKSKGKGAVGLLGALAVGGVSAKNVYNKFLDPDKAMVRDVAAQEKYGKPYAQLTGGEKFDMDRNYPLYGQDDVWTGDPIGSTLIAGGAARAIYHNANELFGRDLKGSALDKAIMPWLAYQFANSAVDNWKRGEHTKAFLDAGVASASAGAAIRPGSQILGKLVGTGFSATKAYDAIRDLREDPPNYARAIRNAVSALGYAAGTFGGPGGKLLALATILIIDPDMDDMRKALVDQAKAMIKGGSYDEYIEKDGGGTFGGATAAESRQFEEWTDNVMTEMLGEAGKDACYHKVKSRYKVWPSAYASGALVKCRKVGAKNWGNKSKK